VLMKSAKFLDCLSCLLHFTGIISRSSPAAAPGDKNRGWATPARTCEQAGALEGAVLQQLADGAILLHGPARNSTQRLEFRD